MSIKIDSIVLAGGRGTRFGPSIKNYGCKSMVPIIVTPAIMYVLRAIREAVQGKIFLCIERNELFDSVFEQVSRFGQKNIEICLDPMMQGTMHWVYKLRDHIQTDCVMVLYGHQFVCPDHLNSIAIRSGLNIITSLYKTSSNINNLLADKGESESLSRIMKGREGVSLRKNQYYIDPPYFFTNLFLSWLQDKNIKCHDAILNWLELDNLIYGHVADFPHEFHYEEEISRLHKLALELSERFRIG